MKFWWRKFLLAFSSFKPSFKLSSSVEGMDIALFKFSLGFVHWSYDVKNFYDSIGAKQPSHSFHKQSPMVSLCIVLQDLERKRQWETMIRSNNPLSYDKHNIMEVKAHNSLLLFSSVSWALATTHSLSSNSLFVRSLACSFIMNVIQNAI